MNGIHAFAENNERPGSGPQAAVACKKHAFALERMNYPALYKSAQRNPRPLRIGFVPLSDCAPLVMAHELNLFARYGLEVQLSREIGWATLRDKLCYGQLDAAHALAPLAFAVGLGVGAPATECVTGLVLNLHGNAITLSRRLFHCGLKDRKSLAGFLSALPCPLILGVPFLYSSHHFLLRSWLKGLGVVPERVAQFVVVPPPQMVANLKAANLDGYCVGEPWNSLAVSARTGWIAATSSEVAPEHPEKVLLVRRDFAESRDEEHERLIAALLEAGRYCAAPENQEAIVQTLARREYLHTSVASLRPSFGGVLNCGEESVQMPSGFNRFTGADVNEPSPEKAAWIVAQIQASGMCCEPEPVLRDLGRRIFRPDLFHRPIGKSFQPVYDSKTENQPLYA